MTEKALALIFDINSHSMLMQMPLYDALLLTIYAMFIICAIVALIVLLCSFALGDWR